MKTYISDSLITESLILLSTMRANHCYTDEEIDGIKTFYGINKESALALAMQCNWITLNDAGSYDFTSFGESIIDRINSMPIKESLYRDILRNYIVECRPIWARRIPFGRSEAFLIMSDEEQICFKKAGLMRTPVSREEVKWWDSLAEIERQEIASQDERIGRTGEEYTIRYEKERTGVDPVWESVNTNLVGYDILSQKSFDNPRQILIEVKASNRLLKDASLFISQNEWRVASAKYNQERYYFYLWLLSEKPRLAIIPFCEMKKHIPEDRGEGEWKEVCVPFVAFKDVFLTMNDDNSSCDSEIHK